MNWFSIFYMFSVADRLGTFFGWGAWLFGIFTAISLIAYIIVRTDENDHRSYDVKSTVLYRTQRWLTWSLMSFCVFLLLYLSTPTRKDSLVIILGGTLGHYLMENKNSENIPEEMLIFLRKEIVEVLQAELEEEAQIQNQTYNREFLMKLNKDQLIELLEAQPVRDQTKTQENLPTDIK